MSNERDPDRDQVLPVPNDTEAIHDQVAADLAERKAFGTRKYGTPLQAHNGRDALLDAYEEALDLCVYLKQAMVEREDARRSGLRLTEEASKRLAEGLDLPPDLITPGEKAEREAEREAEQEAEQEAELIAEVVATFTTVKAGSCGECGHQVHEHGFFSGCLADSGDWTQYCSCTLNQKDFS